MDANSIVVILCLALAMTQSPGTSAGLIAGGRPLATTCTPGELFCSSDCKNVQFCAGAGPVTVDTCGADEVCNYVTSSCVSGSACVKPPSEEFHCHDLGVFPDPIYCTRYHQCVGSSTVGSNEVCPEGKAFDSLSGRCSLTLDSRPCQEGPVPRCDAPGQVGAQPENPNIFYVCVKESVTGAIVPELYKCGPAQVFVVNKCVDSVGTTTSTTATSTTRTSTTGTSTTTTATSATSPTSAPFTCPSIGQFPDPADCRKYFLCNSDLQPNSFTCQSGYYFDPAKGCVPGTC